MGVTTVSTAVFCYVPYMPNYPKSGYPSKQTRFYVCSMKDETFPVGNVENPK